MSENKSHWYQVGVNYLIVGTPIPIPYAVFVPSTEKYDNINHSMVMQFADIASKHIQENNPDIQITNLVATSISYLGHMSNDVFYAK
ncbi:hypothetical protein [Acinetobacter gyllenbergii]|uniref:hypothetical protein n=1 Tax=Acinetobacter gyllenbergii TaxID=134534 RepID=UPI0003BF20EE|nr:hypothetical protein [Acinetobacter gyllenbergii]ESK42137.1 hypothetical protein F987_02159 [Acinetobacter gyllenbergii NIPH 230]